MSTALQSETLLRRKHPRRKFRHLIGVLFRGDYVITTGSEIGEGGVAFLFAQEVDLGDSLVLSFQLPQGPFISVTVELRNQRSSPEGGYECGCFFKN